MNSNYLTLPADFPGLSKMEPGDKKTVLVEIECDDSMDSEEYADQDEREYRILKVDGVPLSEDGPDDESEEEIPDDEEEEDQNGPDGGSFSALMIKGRDRRLPEKDKRALEL